MGSCSRGWRWLLQDGFSQSGGVAVGTFGMIGTGDAVEIELASTSRGESGGFGGSLTRSFLDSGDGGSGVAVGVEG